MTKKLLKKKAIVSKASALLIIGALALALTSWSAIDAVTERGTVRVQQTVSGTVKDAEGEPLVGVSILEKETSNGVSTDVDGNFSITLSNPNATLTLSYIGYVSKEVAVSNQKFS